MSTVVQPTARIGIALLLVLSTATSLAQGPRTARLTEKEIEDVREAAVFPTERVHLYTEFLNQRAAKIKDLGSRPKSSQRVLKLDDALQDFTALMDEMASNLDQYTDRHSDIRKALKPLNEDAPHWITILRALPGEPGFELSRKEAIESGEELVDQAKRLLTEQEAYFLAHKDEKGQERNDDQQANPAQPPAQTKPN